jgi:EmrB/QacA subfamily drug resistance transporter
MTGRSRPVVLLLCCLAQFMVVLDVAIVNVALPSIQRDLHIGQDSVQWVVTAYGLMLGGFLLLGGRLGDFLGRRRILLTGLVIFTGSSVVAGISGSAGILIAARAAQGLGASLIPPAALAILAVTFAEGGERNRALGIFGATTGISASVGVIASGLLTAGPGWRWIFFINLPVGVGLVLLAVLFLQPDLQRWDGRRRFDAIGAVTATGALLLLVYAVSRTSVHGWGSASTLVLIGASGVALAVFVLVESHTSAPLVPAAAVRNRSMIAADLAAFLLFGAIFASIFLGSLFMQRALGYSPTRTGLAWLATTLTSFVAAATSGAKLVGILGPKRPVATGFVLISVAALLLTRVPAHPHYVSDLMPMLILFGLGGGLAAPAVQISALSGVPHNMAGLAGGLVETMREIGGGVNVAVVATVLASRGLDLHAFHSAYWAVFAAAALGLLVTTAAFPSAPRTPLATGPNEQDEAELAPSRG